MASNNTSLGQFNLVGIPPAPRGIPQIEVTFDIDASGILHAGAKDLGTGKEQKMTITASTKLSKDEIGKMVAQAKEHEEEDRRAHEEAEARNTADSLVYTAEKTLAELGDKLAKEQKENVVQAVQEAKQALEGKDIEKIKQETEKLQKVLQEAGASIYQDAARAQQGQQPGEAGQEEAEAGEAKHEGGKKKGKDDVVDADFKVEDDKKG